MRFWNKICGLFAIFFLSAFFSCAQTSTYIKLWGTELYQKQLLKPRLNLINPPIAKEASQPFRAIIVVPQDYYTQHLGIICKKELALEKATKIPFRFRLGSLQQCNYLEGKR